LTLLGKDSFTTKEDINKISDEVYSAIYGRFFSDVLGLDNKHAKYICGKVIETLNEIRNNIGHKYDDLLSENHFISDLINGMSDHEGSDFPGFVGIPSNKLDDIDVKNDYISDWQQLLNYKDDRLTDLENSEIRQLSQRLMIYAYYTSGFNQKLYNLSELIPPKLREKFRLEYKDSEGNKTEKYVSLEKYLRDTISSLNDDANMGSIISEIPDDIMRNNYTNPLYVPQIDSEINKRDLINIK